MNRPGDITIDGFILIKNEHQLWKESSYWINGKKVSPHAYYDKHGKEIFIKTFQENFEKKYNNRTNFEVFNPYNVFFETYKETAEFFYDNYEDYRNLHINEYAKLGFSWEVIKETKDGKGISEWRELKKLPENSIKEKTLNWIIGNFKETVDNMQILSKCIVEKSIPFIRKRFPNLKFNKVLFYIVQKTADGGIDSFLLLLNKGKIVAYVCIQSKYRTPYLNNLKVFEIKTGCVPQMNSAVEGNVQLCKKILQLDKNLYIPHVNIITMNDVYENILTQHSSIQWKNKLIGQEVSMHVDNTLLMDSTFVADEIYGCGNGEVSKVDIDALFDQMNAFNNYIKSKR